MRWNKRLWSTLLTVLLFSASAFGETVYVTGNPASTTFLRDVLESRGWDIFPTQPLSAGHSWRAGPEREVINLDWSAPPVAVVALSDHPEEIENRGQLFSGGLTSLRPVRLQYYHLGSLRGPSPVLWLQLTNPTTTPARIHFSKAIGEPSANYFLTGHSNNVAWFENQVRHEGEFVDLKPGHTVELLRQPLPFGKVVSGTLTLTLVEGSPLSYQLVTAPDEKESASLNNLLKEKDVHSRGFYPVAVQQLRGVHRVGSEETRVAVGALRQETFYGVRELRGDYGVLYDLRLELVNPSPKAARVEFLLNPRGGAATATILMDNSIIEVPHTDAFKETRFATVEIPARTKRQVRLQTVPEGASSYPIRILLRDAIPGEITPEIPSRTEGNSRPPLEILHGRRVSDVDY